MEDFHQLHHDFDFLAKLTARWTSDHYIDIGRIIELIKTLSHDMLLRHINGNEANYGA